MADAGLRSRRAGGRESGQDRHSCGEDYRPRRAKPTRWPVFHVYCELNGGVLLIEREGALLHPARVHQAVIEGDGGRRR